MRINKMQPAGTRRIIHDRIQDQPAANRLPGEIAAATKKNIAEEKSAGTEISPGEVSRPPPTISTTCPSSLPRNEAPNDCNISSV